MRGAKRLLAAALCLALLAVPGGAAAAGELSVQTVEVLGVPLVLSAYVDYDANGYATNYVRLRDVAWALQFTADRFDVSYDGSTVVTTGAEYQVVGTEVTYPTAVGTVTPYNAVLTVDGVGVQKEALLITQPGTQDGSFYYKLRDLGDAIGFGVGWSPDRGAYIETQ